MMYYKKSLGEKVFIVCNHIFLLLLGIAFVYPMIYQIAISFSSSQAVSTHKVFLWPVEFTLSSYSKVFESGKVLRAYKNTIFYTVLGTAFQLIGTTLIAYPLSKQRLFGRRVVSFFFYFTNIFSGGMIPTFLVVRSLGMVDTVWALVVPSCINVYYSIVLRTNFEQIPQDLEDAAKIDGLDNWGILLRIYIPLSKAIYAALTLFFAVGFWNSYVQPLIYLNDDKKFTLQMILRNIVLEGSMGDIGVGSAIEQDIRTSTDTLKAACIMVVMLPVMCIYPFVQKYFVKGIMIGAVKG